MRVWPASYSVWSAVSLRLEVVQEIGPVQRTDVEVLSAELVLGQQGAEHKDRIVAAREGFGIVHLGQPPAAGLRYARLGGLRSRGGGRNGFVFAEGQPHRLAQRERILSP